MTGLPRAPSGRRNSPGHDDLPPGRHQNAPREDVTADKGGEGLNIRDGPGGRGGPPP